MDPCLPAPVAEHFDDHRPILTTAEERRDAVDNLFLVEGTRAHLAVAIVKGMEQYCLYRQNTHKAADRHGMSPRAYSIVVMLETLDDLFDVRGDASILDQQTQDDLRADAERQSGVPA